MTAVWAEVHHVEPFGVVVQHVRIPVTITAPTPWGIPA